MLRRVHREQHAAHLLQLRRVEVLEDNATGRRGEQDRLARDVLDVRML